VRGGERTVDPRSAEAGGDAPPTAGAERTEGPEADEGAWLPAIVQRRERIQERIAAACQRRGRDPSEVTVVAVAKTMPVAACRAAVAAGFTLLGENRVQEAAAKVPHVPGARWHLVGPLQSNKARRAVELFSLIETVDSVELARRLDRLAAELRPRERLPVLLQVNVDRDPAKAGFDPLDVEAALPELLRLPHLDVRGLMTIGRLVRNPEEARTTFAALRGLATRLWARHPELGRELSMGMSDDFEVAVEEGATILRLGRAIFGPRQDGPPPPRQGEAGSIVPAAPTEG
jgi:pyridoxal phosphate enzyme (YggS family)